MVKIQRRKIKNSEDISRSKTITAFHINDFKKFIYVLDGQKIRRKYSYLQSKTKFALSNSFGIVQTKNALETQN